MYTCTISFQRLGHARRTPVQQCNKLSETVPGLMYTCATVEQALKDQDMRDVHMGRTEILLDLHLYIRATSFERLSDTSFPIDISPMTPFRRLSILIFQRWLLWTSPDTLISMMTTLNISRYTYFNDDYFEHILHLYVNDECFEDHMHLFQRRLSVWTIWHAPISKMIHFEHRCRYMQIRYNFIAPVEKFSWWHLKQHKIKHPVY